MIPEHPYIRRKKEVLNILKNKKHGRIKPKYKPTPDAKQKRYHEWVREKNCLICDRYAAIHHVISDGDARISKDHYMVVPICYDHHQGQEGYHELGHDKFLDEYGIHTYDEAIKLLEEYNVSLS